MKRLSQFSGDAAGPFERVLAALLLEHGGSLQQLGPDLAVFLLRGGSQVVLIRQPQASVVIEDGGVRSVPHSMPDLQKVLGAVGAQKEGTEVMLVGERRELLQMLCQPGRGIGRIHWPEHGEPYFDGWEGPLFAILQSPIPPPDWERFWKVLETEDQKRFHRFREAQAFLATLEGSRVIVTPALLVGVAAMWALTVYCGGPDFAPTIVRMGAFSAQLVREGEWWRLVSYAWLHGSWFHLGANGMVLWRLGGWLERMIGFHRLLLLYTTGAIAGGLASMGSESLSVGASGALWAFMTAQAMLAMGAGGFLPPTFAERMRGAVVQNILMNLMISFAVPGINWQAHLGGGLAGAALAVGGALTWGLPRPGTDEPARTPTPLKWMSALSGALLVGSGMVALAVGQPWTLRTLPTLVPQSLGQLSVPLPRGSTPVQVQNSWQIGDPLRDPVTIYVASEPLEGVLDSKDLEDQLNSPPEGLEVLSKPVTRKLRGTSVSTATYRGGERVEISSALVQIPGTAPLMVRVDAVFLNDGPADEEDIASQIAAEVKILPP